jgi:hypothetical protein
MSKPELSIIVPYHQEGLPFITETINSIKETIDVTYEIIVIDDASAQRLPPIDGVTVLRHPNNLGVGQAFNTGVARASSDNLFLMGSDIRFDKNQWASKMIKEIDTYPKSFVCSTCIGLNQVSPEGMDFKTRRNRSRRNGATILVFHDHKSHPKKPEHFRSILECQWLPVYKGESKASFEIPSILGAAYGVKKEWYSYCSPWTFHRSWGTLEPEVSLRSWFFGGSCRTAPDIETGHIFKHSGTHGTSLHHLSYNKIQCATLLFSDEDSKRLVDFLGSNPQVNEAKRMFREVEKRVLRERKRLQKKIVVDAKEWCDSWGIDFRR